MICPLILLTFLSHLVALFAAKDIKDKFLVCFISLILSAGVGSGVTSRIENSFSSGFNSGINSIYDDYDYDEDYYDDEDWFIIIRRKRYQMVSLLFFLNIMEL